MFVAPAGEGVLLNLLPFGISRSRVCIRHLNVELQKTPSEILSDSCRYRSGLLSPEKRNLVYLMSSLNNLPRPIKASIHYSCLLLSEPDRQRIKTQMALLLPFLSLCPASPVIFGVSSFLGASTTLILSQEFNVVMRYTITIIVLRRSSRSLKKIDALLAIWRGVCSKGRVSFFIRIVPNRKPWQPSVSSHNRHANLPISGCHLEARPFLVCSDD